MTAAQHTPNRRRRLRAFAVGAACALTVAVIAPAAAAPTTAPTTAPPSEAEADAEADATIEPQLQQQLAATGTADFWVRFEDRADLTQARRIADWNERGAAVARALRNTAAASQAQVRQQLDTEGVEYEAFWATNAIRVSDGSDELATELAAVPDVESLHQPTVYDAPDPADGDAVQPHAAVEWGIAAINADDVWQEYGVEGAGITVANIDSGVQFDHPALVEQYRGNAGNATFDHDYNWFDAYGSCDGAPCDHDGHGTHTMGTIAGDDGVANQIGVAPEVNWIAANGCCASDAGLIASAQWMLEPTDLDGRNPDASKRPHIVNNSWGSELPSNDPFLADITRAWEASGIFAVWSNGNNGPACVSSGSPGSLAANYSVGAYDVAGDIAGFSSRGPGQDGEIKPNIAAPGVNVRSAIPGGYDVGSGTSMAAPHVTGAVALLWSGAPGLIGDADRTRDLLDGSADDVADDTCGGSAEDNNVYGEGRLDALAMLDAADVADTGTLAVTVTDAETGEPIEGAAITVSGLDRERVTGEDGTYELPLAPGDYAVTASAFGYGDVTHEVTVATDETTPVVFELQAQPSVTVSGHVTDGSGHGWPMYAEVIVAGMPDGTVHTDPVDGGYSVTLPANATYSLSVRAGYPGYPNVADELAVGADDMTHDIVVPVDAERCEAAGYTYGYDGASTDFEEGLPDGWSVVDHNGSGHGWRFEQPGDIENETGGEGGFVIAESPGGDGGVLDSSLVSPAIDLTGHDAPILRFRQDFDTIFAVAQADISLDGGGSWETVVDQPDDVRGDTQVVPIPQAAGEPDVRVRFHLSDNRYSGRYWQVDDFFVGTRSCAPVDGGLVVGHVHDANTGTAVDAASVTREGADAAVRAEPTPDDPGLDDGFFWTFSPSGEQRFTAAADEYTEHAVDADVAAGDVTALGFDLPAGRLSVEPADIEAQVRAGVTTRRSFVLTNTGTAAAQVELRERDGQYEIPVAGADGDGTDGGDADDVARVVHVPGDYSPLGFDRSGEASTRHSPASAPWVDLPRLPTPMMDNAVAEIGGTIYSAGGVDGFDIVADSVAYDPTEQTWTSIAPLPEPRQSAAGAVIDGKFYVVGGWNYGVRPTNTTFVYDPANDSWSSAAEAPVTTAGAAVAVLDGKLYLVGGCTNACHRDDLQRYDPATDTWETLADYPVLVGHPACGALDGQLYCSGGIRQGGEIWNATYAYDPAADTWTRRADMPYQAWGAAYTASSDRLLVSGGVTPDGVTNEGYIYDAATDSWTSLPPAADAVYRAGSTCGLSRVGGSELGGFVPVNTAAMLPTYGDCTPSDVPWLSTDTTTVTLEPGQSVNVRVFLGEGLTGGGVHAGGMWIKEDTPYLAYPVDVTLEAAPRRR